MFLKGKIKSFSTPRGFGFIEVEGDIDDVFFHIKDLPQNNIEPKIGEALQFMIVEDQESHLRLGCNVQTNQSSLLLQL
jgi:cold shock CspA family protein